MRVEPHGIDSVLHAIKRGARGFDIVRDDNDRRDFERMLYYLNDTYDGQHWRRDVSLAKPLERPAHWPERQPLTKILGWTLLSNHFHLILQQTTDGGIAKFMQRLCGSMSLCFNAKYSGKGSIFQGGYKGRVVESDGDLRYLTSYVLVKNIFDMHPQGLEYAVDNFDSAWKWALEYPFSSLKHIVLNDHSVITEDGLLRELYQNMEDFRDDALDMLHVYIEKRGRLRSDDLE
mgnify:FL=1